MVAERLHPHIGGVETHVAGLTRSLRALGHQVMLTAPKHDPGLPDEEQKDSMWVVWLPHTKHRRRDYPQAWRWWAAHRQLLAEADVVHFHDVCALLHWFGPARFLCPGKPVYLTYHGYEMRHPIPLRARFYRWLAARMVYGSICVGHYLAKWFRLHTQAVTYGAVTLPQRQPAIPVAPRAVFVGRLAPDTGIDIYLKGLGLLKRRYNLDLPLTVCGDGPLRPELERLAVEENVDATFIGFVSDPEKYLAQSTLALTSGYLAILEAMALRRPVFSVYHNPVKESYLRDIPNADHMLTISANPDQLAVHLAAFLSDQHDYSPQVEWAYQFAARHTWTRLAETYTRLWELT